MQATLNGLTGVGTKKEVMTATSREATVDRDAAHLRVEDHMIKLVAIAGIVFRDEPEILALFEAAIPASRGRRSKKKTAEAPAP